MKSRVVLDTGPLVALLNRRDRHHQWARDRFAEVEPPLLTCEPVLTEACYLLRGSPEGPDGVLSFLQRGVLDASFDLVREVEAVRRLQRRYGNVPMSLADACLVRLAELHAGSTLLTLDSDFTVYRMHGRRVIPVLGAPGF